MYRLWTEDVVEVARAAEDAEAQSLAPSRSRSRARAQADELPSHCVIFGSRKRSYRELPWRVADFGRLHRYERGGVVHGLSARPHVLPGRCAHLLHARAGAGGDREVPQDVLRHLQGVRPHQDRHPPCHAPRQTHRRRRGMGHEREGARGPEPRGLPFTFSPGEGAFYGPKLEFHVQDARAEAQRQLGTMQYDPNLPERFELDYTGQDGKNHRPVVCFTVRSSARSSASSPSISRAHRRQLPDLARADAGDDPHRQRQERGLWSLRDGDEAEGPARGRGLQRRQARREDQNARTMRYPYMVVVGPKDAEAGSVSVRAGNTDLGAMPRAAFIEGPRGERAAALGLIDLYGQIPSIASTATSSRRGLHAMRHDDALDGAIEGMIFSERPAATPARPSASVSRVAPAKTAIVWPVPQPSALFLSQGGPPHVARGAGRDRDRREPHRAREVGAHAAGHLLPVDHREVGAVDVGPRGAIEAGHAVARLGTALGLQTCPSPPAGDALYATVGRMRSPVIVQDPRERRRCGRRRRWPARRRASHLQRRPSRRRHRPAGSRSPRSRCAIAIVAAKTEYGDGTAHVWSVSAIHASQARMRTTKNSAPTMGTAWLVVGRSRRRCVR